MSTKRAMKAIKVAPNSVRLSPKRPTYRAIASSPKKTTILGKLPIGFKMVPGSELLVPNSLKVKSVVSASKLQAGLNASKEQIKETLHNLTSIFVQDFEVAEIELSVGFNADGKFLGFGVGGDLSIKVKIRPTKNTD